MTKRDFLSLLREKLMGLPQEDVEERLNFYSEMIDDRVEEGIKEEEAVAAIGSVDAVAAQVIADTPLTKLVKKKLSSPKRLSPWMVVLIVLGSPVWVSLLIAGFAVILSLYISLWAVVVSLWAVFVSLVGCAIGGVSGGVCLAVSDHLPSGLALIAAGLICAGLSIFSCFGCRAVTKGAIWLAKQLALRIKRCFVGKGEA